MAFQRHMNIFFFFLLFSCFLFSSQASKFYVGGRDGWVLHPSENYTHWTQKNRFQINDTLVFKYKKGSDSVLLVNKDDYYNCNTKNPIKKLEEGDSEYKLDKSGPFFFISGKEQNCEKGQKLIVTVLSVKHSNTSHQNPPPPKTPTAPTPSSSHTPPSPAPNSLAPSSSSPGPSIAASPISQGPVTNTPVTSPSPSFSPLISPSSSPSFSPLISPASSAPSASFSPGPAPYSYGPASEAPSPESNAPTEAPTYSPAYSSPPQPETPSPESSPPSPSPSQSSPQSSPSPPSLSPASGTPGATPPAQSSGWAVTPTYVLVNLVGSVTILLSVSLGPVF